MRRSCSASKAISGSIVPASDGGLDDWRWIEAASSFFCSDSSSGETWELGLDGPGVMSSRTSENGFLREAKKASCWCSLSSCISAFSFREAASIRTSSINSSFDGRWDPSGRIVASDGATDSSRRSACGGSSEAWASMSWSCLPTWRLAASLATQSSEALLCTSASTNKPSIIDSITRSPMTDSFWLLRAVLFADASSILLRSEWMSEKGTFFTEGGGEGSAGRSSIRAAMGGL